MLDESDYTITLVDRGITLLGGIHEEDYVETFTINNPTGYLSNEKLTLYADEDIRQTFWTNDICGNNTRVLILGDSYMQQFLMDDLAESFYETIELWVWTSNTIASDIVSIVEEYKPDIVIYEKAEREPAYLSDMVMAAQQINEICGIDNTLQ